MNCDEAFDVMTDPNNRDGKQLQWHLEMCPRCRQMREVLAPALTVIAAAQEHDAHSEHSPSRGEEGEDSPRREFLTVETVQLAKETAEHLSMLPGQGVRLQRSLPERLLLWSSAAALLILAGFAIFHFSSVRNEPVRTPLVIGNSFDQEKCLWLTEHRERDRKKPDARTVVMSCLACHMESSIE